MQKIAKVSKVEVIQAPTPFGDLTFIAAEGVVPTSGWSGFQLSPRYYITPPADGVWDFDFYGDPPSGVAVQVERPAFAATHMMAPPWCKGVRVHASTNSMDASVTKAAPVVVTPDAKDVAGRFKAKRVDSVIYRREIAAFDDSFQPIGMCSTFSVRMKKLRHTLTLVIEGPDQNQIEKCVEQALHAGLIAAVIAVFATGGAALQAAASAFISALTNCLGNSYEVRIEDRSHWIEWCT